MSERGLVKDAANIAFWALFLHWLFFTKSGRIAMVLFVLIAVYHSCTGNWYDGVRYGTEYERCTVIGKRNLTRDDIDTYATMVNACVRKFSDSQEFFAQQQNISRENQIDLDQRAAQAKKDEDRLRNEEKQNGPD